MENDFCFLWRKEKVGAFSQLCGMSKLENYFSDGIVFVRSVVTNPPFGVAMASFDPADYFYSQKIPISLWRKVQNIVQRRAFGIDVSREED